MDKLKDFLRFTFTTPNGLMCLVDLLVHLVICVCAFYYLFAYCL